MKVIHVTLMVLMVAGAVVSTATSTQDKKLPRVIKLGVITPPDGIFGYDRVISATTMALKDAQDSGHLADYDIRFIWRNGDCNGKAALGVTVTLHIEMDVDGYIGLPCSIAAINAGKIIAFWDLPHFSFSSVDPELADRVMYNTLIRLMSPHNHIAEAIANVFKFYGWSKTAMVTGDMANFDMRCDDIEMAIRVHLRKQNITMTLQLSSDKLAVNLDNWMERIKSRGRIVLLCGGNEFLTNFMLAAHRHHMTNGEYVFINPTLLPDKKLEEKWSDMINKGEAQVEAFNPFIQVAVSVLSEKMKQFLLDVPKNNRLHPWNYTGPEKAASPYAPFLYDTIWLYIISLEQQLRQGYPIRNGTNLVKIAKTKTFEGKSGRVSFDEIGDRRADYTVWHMRPNDVTFYPFLEVLMTTGSIDSKPKMTIIDSRIWGENGINVPRDEPACGYYNELCKKNISHATLITGAVCFCVLVLILAVTSYVILKRKRMARIKYELTLWKIDYEDLIFIGDSANGSHYTTRSNMTSAEVGDLDLDGQKSVTLAVYKNNVVAVRRIGKTGLTTNRLMQMELKAMHDLSHDNLNIFVGICVRDGVDYTMTKYCSKGSLQKVLSNENMKLDNNFKMSLINDLIKGLHYLHSSAIKYHGALSSKNCVVDGRWVLQITDFGIMDHRKKHYQTDEQHYDALLWTAPEHLREDDNMVGTQQGDIYSFAIILQEIISRTKPYGTFADGNSISKVAYRRVRNVESPPFRPVITPENQVDNKELIRLMYDCWSENPFDRPDMVTIKKRFSSLYSGKHSIIDNMLRMMEKYANDLEDIISDRTKQLTEEKKKTDVLLYRMMPKMVADCLKSGHTYEPEYFDLVSIYFSDIVQFTRLASEATPMEVVDFLSDLWNVFDDIILKYDVYKVETIGDAYMVASGLPVRNPVHHATEIAKMSLDVLASVMAFKIRHKPGKALQVRIGIHSGSVVTGVVGRTMPRYCVFGDTVNTASRFETNGQAMKIHISEQTRDAIVNNDNTFMIKDRGEVTLKGKGSVKSFWLEGKLGYDRKLPRDVDTDKETNLVDISDE